MGISFFSLGLIWCWIVITLWIRVSGIILSARYLQGRWRQMRVIEPELIRDGVG